MCSNFSQRLDFDTNPHPNSPQSVILSPKFPLVEALHIFLSLQTTAPSSKSTPTWHPSLDLTLDRRLPFLHQQTPTLDHLGHLGHHRIQPNFPLLTQEVALTSRRKVLTYGEISSTGSTTQVWDKIARQSSSPLASSACSSSVSLPTSS